MTPSFHFERRARRPFGLAMVAVAALAFAVLIFSLGAHWVIVVVFGLIIAPAIWEILTDASSTLEIDEERISWRTGARGNGFPLSEIDEARIATRMDFSQRARLILKSGRRVSIPGSCLPAGRQLDIALEKHGIKTHRSLF